MPSPSAVKCRGPVVRQLSLQNPLQSPGSHRGLRKQLSEDDTRVLDSVEVTGQGWVTGSERPDVRIGQTKVTRPKAVRVAWADRKQDSLESPQRVEVVATKCPGQPRPMSVKAQRLRNPLLGNKDSLVYSRMQLAERLRNAWSEREKMKPNLNIFLAQGSETTRSENEAPTDRTLGDGGHQDAASTLSDPSAPSDKKRKSMPVRAFSQEVCPPSYQLQESYFAPEKNPEEEEGSNIVENLPGSNEEGVEDTGRYLQELNKIEIRVTKIDRPKNSQDGENQTPEESPRNVGDEESPTKVKRCRNKENVGSGNKTEKTQEGKEVGGRPTAQDRRASFRRSSILHKTITESFSSRMPKDEDKAPEDVKLPLKPTLKKPPLVRAFSAPSQNTDSSALPDQKKVKTTPLKKLQPTVSFDIPSAEEVAAMRDRIKSAPIRRKLKSAAARRKNKDKDSSDEEKEAKESTTKKTTKRTQAKNADIVTMVSLVSPAGSDTEDAVINLPLESWRGTDKEDAPSSRNSTSGAAEEPKDSSAFVLQKFVTLRKTAKSVTFQPHPVLGRSYSASFPSRRAPAGTPIIIPTPVVSNPALTPAQILERDRRSSMFSDGRGIKRRLLRSFTEPAKEEESPDQQPSGVSEDAGETSETQEKSSEADGEGKPDGEPEFKSPKERECWNLYQKMVEKGVAVSFDTVLRGMLTPTEYRLRKTSLLSTASSPLSFLP